MKLLATFTLAALSVSAAELHPAILEAAKSGNKTTLRTLIQQKSDVNAADPDGSTALHWAAHRDDLEAVDALLKAGAKVNGANDLGVTPLWLAAENGSMAVTKRLLDAGADPNLRLLAGESALMVAARGGFAPVVQALLAKNADPNFAGTRGQTALMWAASQKHPEAVKALLADKRTNVQAKSSEWGEVMAIPPHGYLPYNKYIPRGVETALMFAAYSGDLESAKLLVNAGANVNDTDAWGLTPLVLAEHSGFTDMALYFLDKGADPNLHAQGFSALHEALMRRDTKLIAALLEHKADPNFPVKTWTPTRRSSEDWNFDYGLIGASPLWIAARFHQPEAMRLLLKAGADPKFVHSVEYVAEEGFGQATRKERTTLLMAAVGMGRAGKAWVAPAAPEREVVALETVRLAVEELGQDVNAAGLDGKTPLDGARQLRMPTVVEYLTSKGAKSAAPAPTGRGRGAAPAK